MERRPTRKEAVEKMKEFYNSIPEGASSYHKMDMLLSFMERQVGILPPPLYKTPDAAYSCEWEEEINEEKL